MQFSDVYSIFNRPGVAGFCTPQGRPLTNGATPSSYATEFRNSNSLGSAAALKRAFFFCQHPVEWELWWKHHEPVLLEGQSVPAAHFVLVTNIALPVSFRQTWLEVGALMDKMTLGTRLCLLFMAKWTRYTWYLAGILEDSIFKSGISKCHPGRL